MDGGNECLRVDMGVIVEDEDTAVSVIGLKRESGCCCQGLNLEAKIKMTEDKLESLRAEKVAIEDELEVLKRRNQELEEQMRQIGSNGEEKEEKDEVLQLMIENSVLVCEKRKAESDVEYWKLKCNELQSMVFELEGKIVSQAGESISSKRTHPVEGLEDACTNLASTNILQEMKSVQSQDSGKSLTKTPCMQANLVGGSKTSRSQIGNNHVTQVRKRLTFEEGRVYNKRMAPSTPAGIIPTNAVIIDINESDDELTPNPLLVSINKSDDNPSSVHPCTPSRPGCSTAGNSPLGAGNTLSSKELPLDNNLKRNCVDQADEDDLVYDNGKDVCILTPKRRRAHNIIESDSDNEDDDDDRVPIGTLRTRHLQEKHSDDSPKGHTIQTGNRKDGVGKSCSRRRLVKLSQSEGKSGTVISSANNTKSSEVKCHSGISMDDDTGGDDIEEDVSETEGESLGGFIVNSSDSSDDDDISDADGARESSSSLGEDSMTDSEYVSESDPDYSEIMSRIRRNKNDKLEWEFEGDMLAAFGKDPELCMRAVCALYRQQTSEEKFCKGTILLNQRGFSQCDAFRGSTLAEFLTDGDPRGDMIKSVKELQAYEPRGIEVCRTLATRYSKQLFAIYKNREDPLFSAS